MSTKTSLMQFPCDFMIKAIGYNDADLLAEVKSITRSFFPETPDSAFKERFSDESNYLAISANIWVNDQITLDKLYLELSQHPKIKMVL